MSKKEHQPGGSPGSLVGILHAARKFGDKRQEQWARRELRRRYRMSVTFHKT